MGLVVMENDFGFGGNYYNRAAGEEKPGSYPAMAPRTGAKLNLAKARAIREKASKGLDTDSLSQIFGVSPQSIRNIINGKYHGEPEND